MINILLTIISLLLLFIGVISMITPIPGGTFLIAISMSILICSNAKAQACMRFFRTKYTSVNRFIFWLESNLGTRIKFIGIALGKTQPLTRN